MIPHAAFATSYVMTVARMSELDRRTTQSGMASAGRWLLEFEREDPLRADPLTGWQGSGDVRGQISLSFPTLDAAIRYAEREGIAYHVVPPGKRSFKIRSYADNFTGSAH